jgi:hypothetical protein
MHKWFAIIIVIFFSFNGYSQSLAAFLDYRHYIMVFDNEKFKEIDHLPAQSFQVGGNCIAFVTNSGEFRVYYNGNTQILADQFVSRYFALQNILVYFLYDQLYVFDNGEVKMLSSKVKNFVAGDSIVAFFNENTYCSQVYYNHQIIDIERSLAGRPVLEFKAGDNIIAYYNSNSKYLKAFYQGKLWNILQSSSDIEFDAGRNMLAYIDYSKNSFHLFNKGEIIDLEDYEPKSFKLGDDVLAYIDNLGDFKIFYEGETNTITSYEPDFYDVKDSLVIFAEQGYLKVFYKGKVVEFGNFIPEEYQAKGSSMAFIGQNGWLKAFINGEFIKVTSDLLSSFSLNYNTISINTTLNKVKIFSNGRIYISN